MPQLYHCVKPIASPERGDAVPNESPFEIRYDRIDEVDWESCSTVLDSQAQLEVLLEGW